MSELLILRVTVGSPWTTSKAAEGRVEELLLIFGLGKSLGYLLGDLGRDFFKGDVRVAVVVEGFIDFRRQYSFAPSGLISVLERRVEAKLLPQTLDFALETVFFGSAGTL